jgi:uncharacterized protein (TIGR02996 family)
MSERDALLQAIIDNPEDDAPRLVFADWLDDHDEPERAEFIRVQVELANLPEDDPRCPDLVRRQEALLARNRSWREEVAKWARAEVVFRRGFVAHLWTTANQFLKSGAALWKRSPLESLRALAAPDCTLTGPTRLDLANTTIPRELKDALQERYTEAFRS